MQINVTSQIPVLTEHLTELRQRLNGDLTPLMQAIGGILETSTRQRFEDEISPNGVAWAILMPATVKAKNGFTGILKGSPNQGSNSMEGGLMHSIRWEVSSDSLILGTDKPYGKYHQTGTQKANGETKMVARPFLGLSNQDKSDIGDLINDFLAGNL